MEITEVGRDDRGPFVIGTGSLWCDGLRIYEVANMGMRIVSDRPEQPGDASDEITEVPAAEVTLARAKEAMQSYWQPIRQTPSSWLGEDLLDGLADRYVGRICFEGQGTLRQLQDRPAIYLANHQVQIESLIISNLLPALTNVAMTTVANAKHEHRWIGKMIDALDAYPGCRAVKQLAYFDPAQPASMFELIGELQARMSAGPHSFFVHTDGTRAQSCRQPTTKCSSVFLDLALELDLPIVPVRFIGGLPVDPIQGKAEFPVGHGSQEYWIGEPIEAAALRSMPLRDRVDHVITAINTLGGSHDQEVPLAPDPDFARRCESWQRRTGCDEVFATAWQILTKTADPSPETTTLRQAAEAGAYRSDGTATGDWLGDVAKLLFGPHGPTISSTSSEITVVVNQSTHPQLVDHAVNGVPVVPAVYVLEWFLHCAGAHDTDLVVTELTNVKVLKGLVAEAYNRGGDLELTISARTVKTTTDRIVLQLDLAEAGSDRLHYSCQASMAPASHTPISAAAPALTHAEAVHGVRPHASLYTDGVLFHGPRFQVIHAISEMSSTGFTASLDGVAARSWPVEPWLSDPAMLDGGLQMALLWTEHLLGGPSLPTAIGELRVLRPPSPGRFVATLTGSTTTKNRVVCDVAFSDEQGHVVAQLVGIETHVLPTAAPQSTTPPP